MAIIEVKELSRAFGEIEAVRSVSFDVEAGQVVGFIGANGAGKTTTMRIMATLDMPTSGAVKICGYDVVGHPSHVRQRVGWMPDSYGSYANTTVFEYLDFFARAFGYGGRERQTRVDDVMSFTDLRPLAEREMAQLSKGMSQRLCLGRALLNDPEVLILDEPAAGLDPKARSEFKQLVRLLSEEGKSIFISSHILSELGEMCDTLLFINRGKIVHYGSPESLVQNGDHQLVSVEILGDVETLEEWAALNPQVEVAETRKNGALLRFENADAALVAASLRRMIESGIEVTEFKKEQARLEEAFIDLLSKSGTGPAQPATASGALSEAQDARLSITETSEES